MGTGDLDERMLQACQLRDAGEKAEKIVEMIERLRSRICICFVVDTLEYLYRGGRLSRTGALAGRLVHMKPVLTLNPKGEVTVADLCLGRARALENAAAHLKNAAGSGFSCLVPLFIRSEKL